MYTKNDPFFLDYENLRYVMQYDKKELQSFKELWHICLILFGENGYQIDR